MQEHWLRAADGCEIFHRSWDAAGPVRAVVLIAHGASEHSGRYARFAAALGEAGYATYAIDHRGHGRTGSSTGPGRLGARGVAGLLEDLHALAAHAARAHPGVPVVLFGHSMGSLIAQAYAEAHGRELAGLVLSGSTGPLDAQGELPTGIRAAVAAGLGDAPCDLLSGFNAGFEPARTRFDWLSRDPAEVDAYVADPFCGDEWPLSNGYVDEILRMADGAMSEPAIDRIPGRLPVLLITGEADAASNNATAVRELERRLRGAGRSVTALYYPEARHELLNELNRDAVQADVLAWLERLKS